ncbi:hypothetical protein AgCh_015651 [Apium graveolens]
MDSTSSWFTPTVLFCFLNLIIISILIIASYSNKSHKNQLAQHDSSQLNRSSSLLARVKSINFSLKNFDSFQPQPNEVASEQQKLSVSEEKEEEEEVKRVSCKEEKEEQQMITSVKERKNKSSARREAVVKKTASFKEDEQVDAKADDFINRFKQQLKMQRLDSIKRYTQMLTGGGSGATRSIN